MTAKQKYKSLLQTVPTEFIIESVLNPTEYMTKIHIALHYIVLRERGFKLEEHNQ
jgi:hypothetical protein